ncbi:MAG TPA: aminotransferase class I/II-fold pyridoxal phosphate-dependent enzyme [Thermoplasmata archaeon]|jgi:aminotransferase|nr:aminotransferase class I/II-fold pyridoxal phosphate-dependent enzyme [Thermoplasmata archaeon]
MRAHAKGRTHRFAISDARVSRRVQTFPESVIREMTRVAAKHGAINLAQGFPDFDPPRAVVDAAKSALDGPFHQYAITWGAKPFREAIATKAKRFNGIPCDPEANVVVTCGSTEAMMAAMLSLVDRGDEVVIFEPFYENYGPDAIVSGAKARFVRLPFPDWRVDDEALKRAFTARTKAVILNTPNNPTGKVFTRRELKLVADLCEDRDAVAVTDEIYEHIVYEGEHVSIATLGDMADRTVTINGMSKTYSVTGWRVGWAIAPKTIADGIKRVHDFLTVGAPHPLQIAGVTALGLPDSYYSDLAAMYRKKRDRFCEALESVGFEVATPHGAYYVMADVTPFSAKGDVAFAKHLVEAVGVAVVPGSSFYADPRTGRRFVRFMFSKRDETLEEAIRRLQKLRRGADS